MPALASVGNRTLVRHALDWLDGSGIREVAIITPADTATDVRHALGRDDGWGFETRWLEQLPGERFAESLAALGDFLADEPFVLHLADSLSKHDLSSLLGAASTADDEALLVVQESAAGSAPEVIDLGAHRGAMGPDYVRCGASAGVAVIGPAVAQAGAALDAFPQGGLEVLGTRVHELGGRVSTRTARRWWRFRSGADALLEGNRFALEDLTSDYADATLSNADIQGAVIAHPTARIESSVVRGPAILGPRARLIDSYVGPYTSIGPDVVVEGAEIEHSVVLSGASIRHLGGRLEASVVGPHAKVFRDFRLPRALRLQVGEGAEVSLA
ncbi:MAG TPA: sugar phosphate nucleotidyltransferase [Thermoleophilaceae bacterium]